MSVRVPERPGKLSRYITPLDINRRAANPGSVGAGDAGRWGRSPAADLLAAAVKVVDSKDLPLYELFYFLIKAAPGRSRGQPPVRPGRRSPAAQTGFAGHTQSRNDVNGAQPRTRPEPSGSRMAGPVLWVSYPWMVCGSGARRNPFCDRHLGCFTYIIIQIIIRR